MKSSNKKSPGSFIIEGNIDIAPLLLAYNQLHEAFKEKISPDLLPVF